ncbi:MAG: hypothetical protein DYH07_13280 [Armatimonadetes bacterium ATM1]|nr:hypothetical protein [Armatimonadetes bacterium ATM1]
MSANLQMPLEYPDSESDGFLLMLGYDATWTHRFCGPNLTDGGECPNCAKPLLHVASLNTGDRRISLDAFGTGFVPLLYCWRCNLKLDFLTYRVDCPSNRIELLAYADGNADGEVYPDYPDSFPEAPAYLVRYAAVAPRSQKEGIGHHDRYCDDPRAADHRVRGPMFATQESEFPTCISCGREMAFLAAIGDMNLDPRGFTKNIGVRTYYFDCPACRIITAYHDCD